MTRLVRSTGVVLCYPLGHEYYRAHRSYVRLADQLARLGFPVMRFDYFGSGDSEGNAGHARLDDWLNDVADTVEELRRSESVSSIALGGLRFGGALSLLAARRIESVRTLLLWDPVLEGADYVEELQRLHARMLGDLERFPRPRQASDSDDDELAGTSYGSAFLRELSVISPGRENAGSIANVLLVNTAGTPRAKTLPACAGDGVRLHAADSSRDYGWQDVHRIGESIMDPDAIRHFTISMNAVAA